MNEHYHDDDNYYEKIEKMVALTVSAARDATPSAQIAITLAQIANGNLAPPAARNLARVCARILNGERDPIALVEDLSPELAELVWEALDEIEAPRPESDDDEREEITFEQLIEKVAQACTGEVTLWQQLWDFTEELMADERMSSDIQALGSILHRILAGERQKHILDELSTEHRWAVEQLLDWLMSQAVEPGKLGVNQFRV